MRCKTKLVNLKGKSWNRAYESKGALARVSPTLLRRAEVSASPVPWVVLGPVTPGNIQATTHCFFNLPIFLYRRRPAVLNLFLWPFALSPFASPALPFLGALRGLEPQRFIRAVPGTLLLVNGPQLKMRQDGKFLIDVHSRCLADCQRPSRSKRSSDPCFEKEEAAPPLLKL